MASTRRLAAILAADVAGYSRLMGEDEEGTHERIKAHFGQLAEPKIRERRGRVVKNTGDGMLAEFPSVVDAVRCAVEVQRGMIDRESDVPEERRIRFRIGVNLGDVIVEEHDIFGDGVNVAARLEGLAEPGGVCISRVVRDQIRDKLPYPFRDMGERSTKNIARPVRVYALPLQAIAELPASSAPPAKALPQPVAAPRLSIERHLLFDDVVDPLAADARERFEAVARSVRDVLSQRWVRTERTYNRLNPKRIYYLSMEFLIGRSLTNNITNLLLDPYVSHAAQQRDLDWFGLIEQEPDAGLGYGGLGRLAACFLDSMATMELPSMGYGLRYEYGIFRQTIEDGWQHEQPDNWLRRPDPWEVARLKEAVEIKLLSSLNMHHGSLEIVPGRPSTLIGIPFDRPVVSYGGKTVNTLRLWVAASPDYFDFQEFSKR